MAVLTVTQINRYISFKLKDDRNLQGIMVKGEISNFTNHYRTGHLYFTLKDGVKPGPYDSLVAAQNAGAVTMNVGVFINVLISFVIVAFAVFILIKALNNIQAKLDKKEAADAAKAAPDTKKCPFCCTDIPVKATRCPHCTSELSEK